MAERVESRLHQAMDLDLIGYCCGDPLFFAISGAAAGFGSRCCNPALPCTASSTRKVSRICSMHGGRMARKIVCRRATWRLSKPSRRRCVSDCHSPAGGDVAATIHG